MAEQHTFKRYEIKYLITLEQYTLIKNVMKEYMQGDEFGNCSILSLYYDTPDYLLARRSMEHPEYKEKLRLRSYGVAHNEDKVFLEIKKKCDSIVYKRRIAMKKRMVDSYFAKEELSSAKDRIASVQQTDIDSFKKSDRQIDKEIRFFIKRYKNLEPRVLLSYDRRAFYGIDDRDFRITFDRNIRWRDYDLDLGKGIYGQEIIDRNMVLMEVKTAGGIPMWLVRILSENKIYKTSFSKYGTAYSQLRNEIYTATA